MFTRQELEEIASLCARWDCLAVTDEIYEHITYDEEKHISMASLNGMAHRTVTINSISKTYSVTGWRVGWAIADSRITSRIRKVHDFLTVGAPTPFQEAAAFALGMPAAYYRRLRSRYEKSREFLFNLLVETGFRPFMPKGAYYIMAGIGDLMKKLDIRDDFSFSKKLIEMTGVATVPGTSFYSSLGKGRDQIRFCFCKKQQTLDNVKKGLMRLKNA